ncbi:uncharacterized protein LOC108115417 [Drosophila eugracilis]|uniref:uncharacterized protein LOC108115417 n=1 Tax=Drosophila eugracilis TaxID=29029 RepID=UPI001BDACDAA|nr:uncharacterized protein LOC108115417 [Drosophila eugracilis]
MVIFLSVTQILATDYDALIEDPDIYSPCTNGQPGSVFINDAFNMDNMKIELDADGIHVSGNGTVKWSFPATDRMGFRFSVMKLNRGSWEPTVYNWNVPDFCSVMFDEQQYYYKYWWKYIRNRQEVEKNCLKVKDTILEFEPFIMNLRLSDVSDPNLKGSYKVVVVYEAFDEKDVKRPTSLCFEIMCTLEKVQPK